MPAYFRQLTSHVKKLKPLEETVNEISGRDGYSSLATYNHGGGCGKLVADDKQDGIVEFGAFGGRWVCADSIIIHLLDQVEDVQRQVKCKVESRPAGERGSPRPGGRRG